MSICLFVCVILVPSIVEDNWKGPLYYRFIKYFECIYILLKHRVSYIASRKSIQAPSISTVGHASTNRRSIIANYPCSNILLRPIIIIITQSSERETLPNIRIFEYRIVKSVRMYIRKILIDSYVICNILHYLYTFVDKYFFFVPQGKEVGEPRKLLSPFLIRQDLLF
jgi:hypothetical protein